MGREVLTSAAFCAGGVPKHQPSPQQQVVRQPQHSAAGYEPYSYGGGSQGKTTAAATKEARARVIEAREKAKKEKRDKEENERRVSPSIAWSTAADAPAFSPFSGARKSRTKTRPTNARKSSSVRPRSA